MFTGSIQLLGQLRQALTRHDTPRQIGFGIAMGMMVGLVPKDSLLCLAFGILLLISTANLFAATLSTFAFSWLGFLLDPYSHIIGKSVLQAESLQSRWLWLSDQPLAAWTRFDNTVVMGSLLIGLVLFYPLYRFSWTFMDRHGPPLNRRLSRFAAYRWFAGNLAVREDAADVNSAETSGVSS